MYNASKQGGKHRKQTPNKGRVAMVAVTTGAVSTAGLSGAAAATLAADGPQTSNVDIELAADTNQLVDDAVPPPTPSPPPRRCWPSPSTSRSPT